MQGVWFWRVVVLVLLLVLLGGPGCVYRVTPPPEPADPVRVHVARHGRTSSLVLPTEGGHAAYSYGDWRWYAENRTDACTGLAALFVPTRAALGRRQIERELSDRPRPSSLEADEVMTIRVDRSKAESLRERLDERFEAMDDEVVENPLRNAGFVPAETSYWLGHQSSTVVAGWLRDLGCEVRGWALQARFRLRDEE